jgi:hypothetical protein
MQDREDSHGLVRREDGHERWLAMQSAYDEYRRASEALEPPNHRFDDEPQDGDVLPFANLEDRQRVAFERYLESRMEFLEARFDETNPPRGPRREEPTVEAPKLFAGGPVLPIVAFVLVCITAFAWGSERRHAREMQASRDELRAALTQTRNDLRQLAEKVDAQPAAQAAPVRIAQPRSIAHRPPRRRAPAAIPVRQHIPQRNVAAGPDAHRARRAANSPTE